ANAAGKLGVCELPPIAAPRRSDENCACILALAVSVDVDTVNNVAVEQVNRIHAQPANVRTAYPLLGDLPQYLVLIELQAVVTVDSPSYRRWVADEAGHFSWRVDDPRRRCLHCLTPNWLWPLRWPFE